MNLYDEIEIAIQQIQDGWCTLEKAHALASAIYATRPETVIEIGVWVGRSAVPMAMACREAGRGKVICIDPWSNEASVVGYDGAHKDFWSVDHEPYFQKFIQYVEGFGLNDWVDVQRCRSNDYEPNSPIGLLHVDGQHTDQAIVDVKRFAPLVPIGGFCFMDDIDWEGGSVRKAAGALIQLGFSKLYDVDTGAMFQRLQACQLIS